jgi:hypothetical protein
VIEDIFDAAMLVGDLVFLMVVISVLGAMVIALLMTIFRR